MADGSSNMATEFTPDRANTRTLRDAFGRFASGVTIVTTASEDGPVGITANSFSSLSLDPPLVLWSPSVGSRRFPYFERAKHFAIHVLSADQEDLCHGFASRLSHLTRSIGRQAGMASRLFEIVLQDLNVKRRLFIPAGIIKLS